MLKQEGRVTYFVGPDSYFWHPETDAAGPRFARATLIAPGPVRAREGAVSGLGIAHRTLRHWTRPLDEQGPGSFHAPRPGRGGAVRAPGKAAACGRRLAAGETIVGGARLTGVGESTLRQAVRDGRVVRTAATGVSAAPGGAEGTTPSERGRSEARAAEGMGRAGPRAGERTAAALGLMKSAVTRLERCREVDLGGLLAGLPVWCGNGRLSGLGRPLSLPNGQYSARPLPIILGFRALARIGRPEGRRQVPPGELGQAVGLDRVPEGRRLRAQIAARADRGTPEKWMRELSRTGREADPQEAGYLYGDGPVRVQHGSDPLLPRRQVSRERRCWSGPTDYGINDALGRPFFVVSQAVADGRAATRLEELLPERWAGVPAQPSEAERAADPLRPPFVVLFDRAGSSHRGHSKLWERRSGAIPQRKAVKDLWPESEFSDSERPAALCSPN